MLGFYNRSVILTYIGLGLTILGIYFASIKNFKIALICSIGSGFCDMFDAKQKDDKEIKRCGRYLNNKQILYVMLYASVFCLQSLEYFMVLMGYGWLLWHYFVVAGVIRFGYFNVMEQKSAGRTTELRKYYEGLPITSTAILLLFITVFWIFLRFLIIYHG